MVSARNGDVVTARKRVYFGTAVVLFLGYSFLRDSAWRGGMELHTLMETIATVLALNVGILALVRFYSKKDNTFLFVGTGFFATGLLDGYHTIVTSSFFEVNFPSPPPSLVPWSWLASRLFLSVLLWLSWIFWKREVRLGEAGHVSERWVYVIVGSLALTCFIFFAFVSLPPAYYPKLFFPRPQEFLPAGFFLLALIGYLRKGQWKNDAFEHWLILSIIVGFMGQVMFMSFSGKLYDGMFDTAHLLKKLSYICALIGLLISMYQLFLGAKTDLNERKLAEEKIRKLNQELETRVQERTRQLLAAQEELVRKEKLAVLGQVAGSVGHELRNPLGVMSNAVYFLQSVQADADDSIKEYLDIIKSEIGCSERIVSDLLDSVRTKQPHPEPVGVAQLLEQALHQCSVPSSVGVKLALPESLPPLRVDPRQIQQVLRNLISNGVEAMPQGGSLQISAAENSADGTITVAVRDNGVGMTPDQLGKLFQPLFSTKARGIGLGLVVVKNLTEANGGTVKVESAVGKGSVFSVTLPVADERDISI